MARRQHDAYLTPTWATQVLLEHTPEMHGARLLDPSCGDGRMAAALSGRFAVTSLNDLHDYRVAKSQLDLANSLLYAPQPDWVVTNPPFTEATRLVRAALKHATRGVALLLRCTWLEPCRDRAALLESHPPTRILALPRISFTGVGVDTAACWWLIWLRDPATGWWCRGSVTVVGRDVGQGHLPLGAA